MSRKPFYTEYPTCTGCKLMFTHATLENGKCGNCRHLRKASLLDLVLTLVLVALFCGLLGYCTTPEPKHSLAWSRCAVSGDWLETPYCDAVAADGENV
jgi:hypothetical protein